MVCLTSERILKDQNGGADSISALAYTHKSLSDVSCLRDFKNLERLDLSFNNLSSLEGLKFCINLKWLSVSQNKLKSLKGVEGLSKLHVLNAAKNNLRSMNDVTTLISLRALILNDNEIVSICKLEAMKELNTLVLSRNPVCEINDSLDKVKTLTKLSLSKCQLQAVGSSLKSCSELKELRLAHNDIKTLPAELAHNKRLQNLDLGNNLISRWSDMKVLESLPNLKNLNLLGNPIVENAKLAKKVKKVAPNLQIFNSKPIDIAYRSSKSDKIDGPSLEDGGGENNEKKNNRQKISNHSVAKATEAGFCKEAGDSDVQKQVKNRLQKTNDEHRKRKLSGSEDGSVVGKQSHKNSKQVLNDVDVIDDGEISFMEFFTDNSGERQEYDVNKEGKSSYDNANTSGGLVMFPKKKKNSMSREDPGAEALSTVEIGLGGSSAWDD